MVSLDALGAVGVLDQLEGFPDVDVRVGAHTLWGVVDAFFRSQVPVVDRLPDRDFSVVQVDKDQPFGVGEGLVLGEGEVSLGLADAEAGASSTGRTSGAQDGSSGRHEQSLVERFCEQTAAS